MLEINVNERISWDDYFNHSFFKNKEISNDNIEKISNDNLEKISNKNLEKISLNYPQFILNVIYI